MLKLLLAKYADQQHAETDGIKKNFKIEKDKLQDMKDSLPEAAYEETLKQLRLNEENLLRGVDLKI